MDYINLAKDVLKAYEITDPEVTFIRHNENMTFKITDSLSNKNYLLRIHKPVTKGLLGVQHTFDGIKSEIIILEQLCNNSNLIVQKPVVNSFGEYVTDSAELVVPAIQLF